MENNREKPMKPKASFRSDKSLARRRKKERRQKLLI